jgi:hypothetical protein
MSDRMATTPRKRRLPRHRAASPRRGLRVWLVLILATASISVIGATAPLSAHSSAAGASSPCASDGNGGCQIVLPCPVGQTTDCPTVDVTPNGNLSDGQYVFISTKNFDPTGSIRVSLCSAVVSTPDPQCLNGNWESQAIRPTSVPVTANPATNNLTSISYPVYSDPAGQGNDVIPSYDLVNKTGRGPGFYCDNASDPCEVIVSAAPNQGAAVGAGPLVSSTNSAIVPLHFSALSNGCPSTAPQVQVEGAYSIEHFLPAATQATCAGKDGVVPLNTPNDNTSAINDFASGGSAVSFVDNPSDPAQLAQLLGKSYAYIPVALSGTTESFLAGETNQGQPFPVSTFNLTPNMVSGLITSTYQSPLGNYTFPPKAHYTLADNLVEGLAAAGVTCATLEGCPSTKGRNKQFLYMQKYEAFDMLNAVPAGYVTPQTYGSFNSNVSSGSSFQATNWLCTAPNTPFTVPVAEVGHTPPVDVTVTDTNVAPTTLTTPPLGTSIWPPYAGAPWVYPDCHGYSTFPALAAQANNYGPAQSPAGQAKAMRGWCFGGGVVIPSGQSPCAAFGLMDTSEAAFYGLSSASLENASGHFVAPTISSLEAAATTGLTACPAGDLSCPAGTYSINYGNTDRAAYPMPDITYAVVPTSTLPYDQAQAIKHMLTNLVTYAHGSSLPAGYAPLPDAIYSAAITAISKDITSGPAPVAPTTTTTTTTAASTDPGSQDNSGSPSTQDTPTSDTSGQTSELPLTSSDSPGSSGSSGDSSSTPVAAPPSTIPTGFLLVGLSATTRFLLPAIVVLALGSLVGGLLLLFGPGSAARRRRSGPGDMS